MTFDPEISFFWGTPKFKPAVNVVDPDREIVGNSFYPSDLHKRHIDSFKLGGLCVDILLEETTLSLFLVENKYFWLECYCRGFTVPKLDKSFVTRNLDVWTTERMLANGEWEGPWECLKCNKATRQRGRFLWKSPVTPNYNLETQINHLLVDRLDPLTCTIWVPSIARSINRVMQSITVEQNVKGGYNKGYFFDNDPYSYAPSIHAMLERESRTLSW